QLNVGPYRSRPAEFRHFLNHGLQSRYIIPTGGLCCSRPESFSIFKISCSLCVTSTRIPTTHHVILAAPDGSEHCEDVRNSVPAEELMGRTTLSAGASLVVAMIFAFVALLRTRAQDPKTPIPSMAPVDQYLMPDRDAEIALARTAAPDAISRDATIFVL